MSTQESAAPQPIRPAISPVGELRVFPHILPTPLMPFVGRVEEMRRYTDVLFDPSARLLTLTGPGGVGKTRLAIALAHTVRPQFPHGVVFVPLTEVREVDLVLPAIARALELPPDADRRSIDVLVSAIGSLRVLLVLDNLEQLGDAAPDLADLLHQCPELTVLATSRVPLDIRGELQVSLEPLALPGPDASVSAVEGADAVAFFLQVARRHVPDFALTDDNRSLVVQICRRVEGLPLALELAASQLRTFSPATLSRLLEHRLDVLTAGPRDLPDRQRTLRNTIRWSYDLLDPDDRVRFRRLGVFTGGFTLESAGEVLGIPEGEVIKAIRLLVDHHLVRPVPGSEGRFQMLETIREFALEALDETGERHALDFAHAEWGRMLAVASVPALTGIDQRIWLDRLDAEQDNLRAAMVWGSDHAPEVALQIASSLWRYWVARGRAREGREWVRRALAAASDAPTADRASGLFAAAELAENLMELPEAIDLYTRGQEMYAAAGDDAGVARCLNGRGVVARTQGRLDEAEGLHREALRHLEHADDRRETAVSFNNLGAVAYYRADPAEAERAWEQALAISREIGDARAIGMVSGNLGAVALHQGDPARAAALHEEGLRVARRLRDAGGIARSLINLGSALTEAGDLARAREHLEDGLNLARDIDETGLEPVALYTLGRGALLSQDYPSAATWFSESLAPMASAGHLPGVATALEGLGCVASGVAWHEDAVRLFCVADHIREETGAAQEGDDPLLDRAVTRSRSAIGSKATRILVDQTRGLTIEDVMATAMNLAERIQAGSPGAAEPEPEANNPARQLVQQYGLTRREIEILRYVVDHRSDKEIGDVLFISPRTVGTHVTSVRNKMGLNSRREAARIAGEMGLGEAADVHRR
jgi:predicted ATPase/DNA-binding CsgD family transcriptional regulator/Tfp pilus assembly protein PilF